jgi:putative ABC transport system permease protein
MSFVPAQLPRAAGVSIDRAVLGFAFVLSLVSGAALGLFPAWHLSRGELQPTLQTYERATLPAQRIRLAILATEVALAVVLLAGAALFARSFVRLVGVDLGFAPKNVLSLRVRTLESRYATVDQQRAFLEDALDRLAALPGVTAVAAVEMLPVTRARRGGAVTAAAGPVGDPIEAEPRVISPGYFETMGIDVVMGRPFDRRDSSAAPQVAVINETLAQRLWPGARADGQRLRYESYGTVEVRDVIGVVRDVRGFAVDAKADPQLYLPYPQSWLVPPRFVIRTAGDPEHFVAAVRHELRLLDSRAAIENIQPLTAHVAASIAQPRFQTWLLAVFGASGLLLAAVGIGGVVAYSVSRQTREIGIRMALGAGPRDVMRTVTAPSLVALGIGLAAGLAAALALGRVARAFLFEIEPHDPVTLGAVVVALGATALVAAWLPARRAQRIDPLVALRSE